MARIRTIKPEFWTSEQVVDCSPTARLLFVGLWTFSDDGGVHPHSIKRIKMEIFPGDDFTDQQVSEFLEELIRVKLVRAFVVDGERFLLITGWKHQKIEKPTLRWPQPTKATEFDDSSPTPRRVLDDSSPTPRRVLDDSSPPEWKGMEGNGMESKGEDPKEIHCATATATPAGTHDAQFSEFWQVFPSGRKKNRKAAYDRWKSAIKRAPPENIIAAAREYAESDEGRGEFVKMPETWLNKDCWNDERDAWKNRNGNGKLTTPGPGQRYHGD